MITIDNRIGSKELYRHIPHNMCRLDRLEFGDVAFTGKGKDKSTVLIGIERKTIGDFVNSMSTGRLSGHQLIGLSNSYDYSYIIIEGMWRGDKDGMLEVYNGKRWKKLSFGRREWYYNGVEGLIETLSLQGGMQVRKTYGMSKIACLRATAGKIMELHHYWNSKEYEEHRSHLQFNRSDAIALTKQSLVRRVANQLSGVGWKRAKEIDKHFNSVVSMCVSDEQDWFNIEGIGKTLSKQIVKELNNDTQ